MLWLERFFTGFVGAVVGAGATILLQRLSERKNVVKEVRHKVFLMLLDLNTQHFWIVASDMHGNKPSPEIVKKFDSQCWRIADELRKVDELPELEDILRAMFSLEFETEEQRSEALGQVIDRLGQQVNPRYAHYMRKISSESQSLMTSNLEESFRRKNKVRGL